MALGPQGALKVRTQALSVTVISPCTLPQAFRELVIPVASVPWSLCYVSGPVAGQPGTTGPSILETSSGFLEKSLATPSL